MRCIDREHRITVTAIATYRLVITPAKHAQQCLCIATVSEMRCYAHKCMREQIRSMHECRAAATASSNGESSEKLQLQLRQAQQMAAAVARKKEDMLVKLKRLTDKQVLHTCYLLLTKQTLLPVLTPFGALVLMTKPDLTRQILPQQLLFGARLFARSCCCGCIQTKFGWSCSSMSHAAITAQFR